MPHTHDILDHLMHLMRLIRRQPGHGGHFSRGVYNLLREVVAHNGIRTAELAQRLDIRPSSLTEQLQRAEAHDLIVRQRDPDDSRAYRISATQKARDMLSRGKEARVAQARQLSACLTEEEAALFCSLCDKLSACLEQTQASSPCADGEAHGHRGHRHGDKR